MSLAVFKQGVKKFPSKGIKNRRVLASQDFKIRANSKIVRNCYVTACCNPESERAAMK